jgi:hypothetical protein
MRETKDVRRIFSFRNLGWASVTPGLYEQALPPDLDDCQDHEEASCRIITETSWGIWGFSSLRRLGDCSAFLTCPPRPSEVALRRT